MLSQRPVAKAFTALVLGALAFVFSGCSTNNSVSPDVAALTDSPLDEYLAAVWGTNLSLEEQQRQLNAEALQREEIIQQCMHDAGFEYVPNPFLRDLAAEAASVGDPDGPDWVSQNGYGLIITEGTGEQWDIDSALADPNRAIRESLSEKELEEYLNKLETCSQSTWQQTGETRNQLLDEFAPLFEAIDDMRTNLWLNPTAADQDWAACMAEHGNFDFKNQEDAQQSIMAARNTLWPQVASNWNFIEQGPISATTSPEFATLLDQEIELALVDLDCREQTNFRARQRAHQIQVETQFVTDHQAALEALRLAAEQAN